MFVVWLGFTTSLDPQELITGLLVSFAVALLTAKYNNCCGMEILHPKRIFLIIKYFIVFMGALFKANIDVAKRVLSPSLPINPGIVEFESKLHSEFAKMILANSITLTPGTLSVDVVDQHFYIHWLEVKSVDSETAYNEIAKQFEDILLKIYS